MPCHAVLDCCNLVSSSPVGVHMYVVCMYVVHLTSDLPPPLQSSTLKIKAVYSSRLIAYRHGLAPRICFQPKPTDINQNHPACLLHDICCVFVT